MNANIKKTQIFRQLQNDLKGIFYVWDSSFSSTSFSLKSDLSNLYMNVLHIKTHFSHKMKYDLKVD